MALSIFWILTALCTFIIGIIFIITVIGAPIGLGMIQHSKFLLTPFSKRMISDSIFFKTTTIKKNGYTFIV